MIFNPVFVFLIAASPIAELRGAIPFGLSQGLPLHLVFPLAILGNLIPVVLLLKILPRFFPQWLWAHTHKRHKNKFARWGEFALIPLVAIPLPFTGAWTGSLAAIVFGIPFKKSLLLISVGVVMAAIIVSLLTLGVLSF